MKVQDIEDKLIIKNNKNKMVVEESKFNKKVKMKIIKKVKVNKMTKRIHWKIHSLNLFFNIIGSNTKIVN